jgi:hypothetical protein
MSTAVTTPQTDSNFGFSGRSEILLSVTFLLTLVVLLIPLPTVILDMLLAVNLECPQAAGCQRLPLAAPVADHLQTLVECRNHAFDSA